MSMLFRGFPTTAHFSEETIEAVEARLTEKAGKTYVRCLVRQKDVFAASEERGLYHLRS
jgi:hypothetical protein